MLTSLTVVCSKLLFVSARVSSGFHMARCSVDILPRSRGVAQCSLDSDIQQHTAVMLTDSNLECLTLGYVYLRFNRGPLSCFSCECEDFANLEDQYVQ